MTLSTAPAPEGAQEPATVTFSDFGLHPDVLKAVTAAGYTKPTPIQAKAIPVVMAGHDVMAAAQTGTGKTAGFALPIINALMPSASHSASPARHPVRALIIAPTRELADQIHDNVKTYIQFTPLRSAAVFGGVDMQPQTNALRAGVEILIATPGRLLDHVQQKSVNLSQVQLLVLDEADRMLDMGFLPDIQRIINLLNPRRQNLMFSATFSDEIRKLAKRFLNEPKLIEVARPNTLAENVEQTVYHVPSEDLKRDAVGALIRERGIEQVIVFSNTKIGAGRLARHLQKEGFLAEAIHGDKSQQERLKTLDGFKAGEIKVLVATDVAARGLDIAELPAVINYDLPHSPEDYVHRIGRTGRAGASGMALSLMVDHDQKALAEIEKLTKRKLDVQELQLPASARGRGERRSRDDRRGPRDGGEAAARSEDSRGIGAPSRSGRDRGSRREGNCAAMRPVPNALPAILRRSPWSTIRSFMRPMCPASRRQRLQMHRSGGGHRLQSAPAPTRRPSSRGARPQPRPVVGALRLPAPSAVPRTSWPCCWGASREADIGLGRLATFFRF
ncbi:MAG: DEAD/DEAH box helicase [Lautropia mirabilis]|nr:DEAD/DEAH box helicase [Lautropia mirabilis]